MPNSTLTTTLIRVVDPCPNDYRRLAAYAIAPAYQFLYAASGNEALRLPRQTPPGLWLINFHLPDISGVELLALIRAGVADALCALVGDSYSTAEELTARQAGASFYACKPLSPSWLHLLLTTQRTLSRDHSALGLPKPRVAPPGLARGSPVLVEPLRNKPDT